MTFAPLRRAILITRSYPWIFPLHNGRASVVRRYRSASQLLPGLPRHRSSSLGRRSVLLCPYPLSHHLPPAGLYLEIVGGAGGK